MKDSFILENGIFYYGKVADDYNLIDNPLRFSTVEQIPVKTIKQIQFHFRRKRMIIEYGNDREAIINPDDSIDLHDFYRQVLHSFPNAKVLGHEQTRTSIIRKPLFAIFIIVIVVILISISDSFAYRSSRRRGDFAEVLVDLFRAFRSWGMPTVFLVFGSLVGITLTSMYIRLRKAKGCRIIRFNQNNSTK